MRRLLYLLAKGRPPHFQMRLLDTTTKKLNNFKSDDPPVYAILSHCWSESGEVQFGDLSRADVEQAEGYSKLSAACDVARQLGVSYLWMDTCCIDRSSSSEQSEAISCMHRWYKQALFCIVYLGDVEKVQWQIQLSKSQWFTRGWTLQELIAPRNLFFVDKHWSIITTKAAIVNRLVEITGIVKAVLLTGCTQNISVAARMSWAAGRKTSRPEDIAYSLMGIFDVNMTTRYGEGNQAFIRLQEEIIKKSLDQSIFAWGALHDEQRHVICCI